MNQFRRIVWSCLLATLVFFASLVNAADLDLQYDANGNVISKTTASGTTNYTYDALDRINTEAGPPGNRDHAYDANGNRLTEGAGTTATFTPNSDQVATINGIAVTLDAAGNLTSDGNYKYLWNGLGQLGELRKADNTLIATYYYDYRHRRTRKVTTAAAPQGISKTFYHYDLQDHLVGETTPGNQPQATYVWNGDILTGYITYNPRTVYTVQVDHLGTPYQVRTIEGKIVWRLEADGYGRTAPNEDVDGDGKKLTLNVRFPGQYFDRESGLHYNWHRYYSPKLGRYISPDPIGLAGGMNMFGYVRGNPLKYTDPTGEIVPALVYGAVATVGFVSGAIIANGVPQAGPKGSDDLLGGATGASSSRGGTGTGTQSGSLTEQCPPVDECAVQLEECLKSETQSKRGSVYGSSRCLWCSEACKRNGGTWPKTVPTSAGGYLSCKIK